MTLPACMDCDRDAVVFIPATEGAFTTLLGAPVMLRRPTRDMAFCLACARDNHGWPGSLRGEKPKRRRRLPYHVAAPTAPLRLGHPLPQIQQTEAEGHFSAHAHATGPGVSA